MSAQALLGAARLRSVLSQHGVRPRKSLGQNFVIDPNTIRKVVACAGLTGTEHVVEIGAGAGSLTLALAEAAESVLALEYDERLLPVLHEILSDVPNVEVVHADALDFRFDSRSVTHLVANLPYNIAATVVLKVLEESPSITSLTVMTQREVGERLAASPGSSAYGATSVLVSYWGAARVSARISRRAFFPVPNVDSVVVTVTRRAARAVGPEPFYRVVKAAFGQRRKTLRNTLSEVAGSPVRAEEVLARLSISPDSRAEEIGADQFEAVAHALE